MGRVLEKGKGHLTMEMARLDKIRRDGQTRDSIDPKKLVWMEERRNILSTFL
eukprot:COSAG01_NODE_2169_length_8243_cov_3.244720_8_plen_52_part_00